MRLEQHEDHHIGPKQPESLAHRLFGTWQLGGDWGQFDEEAAVTAIRRARDLGVTAAATTASPPGSRPSIAAT